MIDILTTAFGNVLAEIITTIAGIVITAAGTAGAFYLKRLNDNLKKSALRNEITRYVDFAEKAKSFTQMTFAEKSQTIFEKAREFADENEIKMSDRELLIIVESSLGSLEKLKTIGERVFKTSRSIE